MPVSSGSWPTQNSRPVEASEGGDDGLLEAPSIPAEGMPDTWSFSDHPASRAEGAAGRMPAPVFLRRPADARRPYPIGTDLPVIGLVWLYGLLGMPGAANLAYDPD